VLIWGQGILLKFLQEYMELIWRRRYKTKGKIPALISSRILWARRLASNDDPVSCSRKFIFIWNGSANAAANLVAGNFLVGLYAVLNVSDALLGILTTLIQLCNVTQILSPLILNRFKQKKKVLMVFRVLYYTLTIVVIGLIPYFPATDGIRIGILLSATVCANLVNALVAPGYSILHIRSIPREWRADFFSVLTLLNNICVYVPVLLCGKVVDFFRDSGSLLTGLTVVRCIAIFFAVIEIFAHCHVLEFDEPDGAAAKIKIAFPFGNKKFMMCTVLTGMYSMFANIPGMFYSSYLVNDIRAPFSFLGFVSILSVPIMIVVTPLWNLVIRKTSWFIAISVALLSISVHYFILALVNSANYLYVYTLAMIICHVTVPGVSMVSSNLPYYYLPEEGRSGYLAFYAAFNSFMAMLGIFFGNLFIIYSGPRTIRFLGEILGNKQYILMIVGFLLFLLGIAYQFVDRQERRQG
jgi:uncharacterized membrane protein (DUF485 family)